MQSLKSICILACCCLGKLMREYCDVEIDDSDIEDEEIYNVKGRFESIKHHFEAKGKKIAYKISKHLKPNGFWLFLSTPKRLSEHFLTWWASLLTNLKRGKLSKKRRVLYPSSTVSNCLSSLMSYLASYVLKWTLNHNAIQVQVSV